MKHYITGYREGEDHPSFKIRLPLLLADLRKIMQWEDDGDCVFDNELSELQARKIAEAGNIEIPPGLYLLLTTEVDI